MNYLLDFYRTGQNDFYIFSQKKKNVVNILLSKLQKKKKALEIFPGQDIFSSLYIFVGRCVSSFSIMQLLKLFVEKGPFGEKV